MAKKVWSLLLLLCFIMGTTIGYVDAAAPSKGFNAASAVKGSIKDSGKALKNSLVLIREKGKLHSYQVMTNASGAFTAKLPDGKYTVKGMKNKTGWVSTNKPFAVSHGKINGLKNGEINITKNKSMKRPPAASSNFMGVLKEGNKGLKADLIISKYSEYDETIYQISSIGDGSFRALLPDGDYYMYGIEKDGGFYRHELIFTIEGGKVYIDGEQKTSFDISVPVNAISGYAADSTSPFKGAAIVLEKRLSSEDYDREFIQYVVSDNNGKFSFRALEDGEYTVSVYHETYYSWDNLAFKVVSGKVYIGGKKVSSLFVKIPDVNLTGRLMEGKQPISNAYVYFERKTAEGEYDGYGTPVDSTGRFTYRLPDGNYTISVVEEFNRTTPVDIPFEIKGGKLLQKKEIIVNVPSVNFKGKLLDGSTVLPGAIFIKKDLGDGDAEWFDAVTDEKGIYSLRLKDGNYSVTGAYLFSEDEEVALSASFDIINGQLYSKGKKVSLLELKVPPITLHGIVKDGEKAITDGYVSVISEDWSFYSGKMINPDGTFTMRLQDGNFTLSDIQLADGTTAFLQMAFSMANGKTYVNGHLQDILEVSIPPVTLTGFLSDSGQPVMGDVRITEVNDAENPLDAWGWADQEGKFQLRLPDGDYNVQDVFLYDNTAFSPSVGFSIKSGILYVNGEQAAQLNIDVPPLSVSGTVMNGDEIVTDGYMAITPLDGNWTAANHVWIQDGHFMCRLPDGEYEIDVIEDFYTGTYGVSIPFIVTGGKLVIGGKESASLDINIQDWLK